ncbi:MAG TPA: ATP-binding protein, partial [Burkholderiaceae bacterium]|nr:ATP-binding protein [Burkholderiaceae bacterium]
RQRQGIDTIEHSGRHLLTLINDILDLARIEAGKLELTPETVALPAFLQVVADIIRVRAEQRDLLFTFHVSHELPRAVSIDAKRLRQVLLNLLSNAVKFTDQGHVALRVSSGAMDGGQARLRVEVEDTGIGIRPEKQAMVFEPFEQVSDAAHRVGGAGLGLAISRALVRRMGGDIRLVSTPGRGSCFWFEMPVQIVAPALAAPRTENAVAGYHGNRRTILVVDDDAQNRALLSDFLGTLGFRIVEAVDGLDGVSQARAQRPDLIVLDNVMPNMSGLEAARRMREMNELSGVPILAVSASASAEHARQSLAVGIDDFVPKPVDLNQLVHKIGLLLQLTWTDAERRTD